MTKRGNKHLRGDEMNELHDYFVRTIKRTERNGVPVTVEVEKVIQAYSVTEDEKGGLHFQTPKGDVIRRNVSYVEKM